MVLVGMVVIIRVIVLAITIVLTITIVIIRVAVRTTVTITVVVEKIVRVSITATIRVVIATRVVIRIAMVVVGIFTTRTMVSIISLPTTVVRRVVEGMIAYRTRCAAAKCVRVAGDARAHVEAGEHIIHVVIERRHAGEEEKSRDCVNGIIIIVGRALRAVSEEDGAGVDQSHSRARTIQQLPDARCRSLITKKLNAAAARCEHFQAMTKVVVRVRAELAHLPANVIPIALIQVAELQRRLSLSA